MVYSIYLLITNNYKIGLGENTENIFYPTIIFIFLKLIFI